MTTRDIGVDWVGVEDVGSEGLELISFMFTEGNSATIVGSFARADG